MSSAIFVAGQEAGITFATESVSIATEIVLSQVSATEIVSSATEIVSESSQFPGTLAIQVCNL